MRTPLEPGRLPAAGEAVVAPTEKRSRRRRNRKQRGQSLVEFAMVAPLFLLMVFGMVDFGIGFYSWITVTNAAREGARLGAVQGTQGEIVARVNASADQLDTTKMTVTVVNAQGLPGEAVAVDVDYDFQLMTPLAGLMGVANINISSTSTMRLE